MTKVTPLGRKVAAINVGSSSIKFATFEAGRSLRRRACGAIEGIGTLNPSLSVRVGDDGETARRKVAVADHASAIELLGKWVDERDDATTWAGVGFRVVHGGPNFCEPIVIDRDVIAELEEIGRFDPQHQPYEVAAIKAIERLLPDVPRIACFDTAFHRRMPRLAQILPIPRRFDRSGVRRYGFHGLSYGYVIREFAVRFGAAAARRRVIIAHLGSGASLAALKDGRSFDTSMGFSPNSGIPMGTRSGDVDPGVIVYLERHARLSTGAIEAVLNRESGLLGMSETGSDMSGLLEIELDDFRAAEAIAVFCYETRKKIGAYAAALGGIDALVFTGGIGENSPVIRSRVCEGLDFLGIAVEGSRNDGRHCVISPAFGRVIVCVIPTDEEQMIARLVCRRLEIHMDGGDPDVLDVPNECAPDSATIDPFSAMELSRHGAESI